ncbi:MAG: hypothetical protein GX902_07200 [Lentisphaerae bacterium]|nr:hypothetical protein [Lentisphaerota bacterium]
MQEQFLLNFKKDGAGQKQRPKSFNLRLAVLKWLHCTAKPDAWAVDVPLKAATLKADVVACWQSVRRHRKLGMNLVVPRRTVVVLCAENRKACWPECSQPEDILAELGELREKMRQAEQSIRNCEPHLREENVLFEEFAFWDYAKSTNAEYQQMRRRLRNLEESLYRGSRLHKIARTRVADELYLAVPDGEIAADEVISGWGLLAVHKNLEISVKREATVHECLPEARMHLIQNMLVASKNTISVAQGLRLTSRGWCYVQPGRSRKVRRQPEL